MVSSDISCLYPHPTPSSPRAAQALTSEENLGQMFLQEYASQLVKIEDLLDDSLGDFWNVLRDPISLAVCVWVCVCSIFVSMYVCEGVCMYA
jgi:hypothetical protein